MAMERVVLNMRSGGTEQDLLPPAETEEDLPFDDEMDALGPLLQRIDEQNEELRIKAYQVGAYETRLKEASDYMAEQAEEIKLFTRVVDSTPETPWNATDFKVLREFHSRKTHFAPPNLTIGPAPQIGNDTETSVPSTLVPSAGTTVAVSSTQQSDVKAKDQKVKTEKEDSTKAAAKSEQKSIKTDPKDSKTSKASKDSAASEPSAASKSVSSKATKVKREGDRSVPIGVGTKVKQAASTASQSYAAPVAKKVKKEK